MGDSVSQHNKGSGSVNQAEQTVSPQGSAPQPSRPTQNAPKRAKKKQASSTPTLVPPGQPASAYKPVSPNSSTEQQSNKKGKKGSNKLLVVGIVVCTLAVAALTCALLYVMNNPTGNSAQQSSSVPSNSQITKALEDANLKPPDISSYKYVSTDGLSSPEFTEIETEQGSSSNVCNVSAKSVFKNSSVMIEQPVALRFTERNNDWVPGTVTTSPAQVTPTGAPDIQALTKDLPNLLQEFDSNVANQFTNCDIAADTKDLTEKGGSVKFTLEKAENDTVKKCDVNMKLEWKNNTGWDPQIESVSSISTDSAQSQSSTAAQTTTDSESSQPDALLQCSSGDLVQIPGIIDYVSDRFLLRSDYYIRVEMDGKVFDTRYFELQSNTMQFTVGSHVEVTGTISETGILRQAPLVLNLDT